MKLYNFKNLDKGKKVRCLIVEIISSEPVLVALIAIAGGIITIVSLISTNKYNRNKDKKKLMTETISLNRIQWIANVRAAMHEFLEEYLKGFEDECLSMERKYNLRVARAKIELYISHSPSYINFSKQLKKCSIDPFSEDDYENFIIETQKMLTGPWRMMKREAGITYKEEKDLTNKVKKEMGEIADELKKVEDEIRRRNERE